jgi:hypothetical protein
MSRGTLGCRGACPATQVAQAVGALREEGPALGRPLVDRLKGTEDEE